MHPRSITLLASLLSLAIACSAPGDASRGDDGTLGGSETGGPTTGGASSTGDEPGPTSGAACGPGEGPSPQETAWETVVDALPFPPEVRSITIGGKEYDGNFANRGDIEVLFDADDPVITVEMRVYDFTDELSFTGPDGTRERLALWAYRTDAEPAEPQAMPPADDCTVGAWKDGCKLRVYYAGQFQPLRSGADLRVHLPRSYRGRTDIATEDNLAEVSYPRLGDIAVRGMCGSGDVRLAAGTAQVHLCRELTPAPTCPAADVAACEGFQDEMGNDAAWSPQCPCSPDLYGQLRISSAKPWAADITVDIPDTTWINVAAANESPDKPHDCLPKLENCTPDRCTLAGDMYAVSGEYNYPSPAAPAGAGFNLAVSSAGCSPVEFFADQADWCAMAPAMQAEHGHIRVCTDCL